MTITKKIIVFVMTASILLNNGMAAFAADNTGTGSTISANEETAAEKEDIVVHGTSEEASQVEKHDIRQKDDAEEQEIVDVEEQEEIEEESEAKGENTTSGTRGDETDTGIREDNATGWDVLAPETVYEVQTENPITYVLQADESDVYEKKPGGVLTDDSAYISSYSIKRQTGTPTWDTEEGDGNDTTADDNIVRSFDSVTYTVENTMNINETGHGSKDADYYYNFKGGKIYFSISYPEELDATGQIEWDTGSMGWISDPVVKDGTLTGYYQMDESSVTIPGKQNFVFMLKIYGLPNGTVINPELKVWLQGNDTDEVQEYRDDEGVIVSAKPSCNIVLRNNNTDIHAWRTWKDENGDEKSGRVYGYGIMLQLYNTNSEKGLKGIEYPQGDIAFDIDLSMTRISHADASRTDISNQAGWMLYNYKMNDYNSGNYQGKLGDSTGNRTMIFAHHSGDMYAIPISRGIQKSRTSSARNGYVYNGGDVQMAIDGDTLHVTVSGYGFDGVFPGYTADYSHQIEVGQNPTFGSNIGVFSTIYFLLAVPNNEATTVDESDYAISLKAENIKTISISGDEITEEATYTDNTAARTHVRYSPGSYAVYHWLYKKDSYTGLYSHYYIGDAKAFPGDVFRATGNFTVSGSTDPDYEPALINHLLKFDASVVEPVTVDGEQYTLSNYGTNVALRSDIKFRMLYAAKPDGTNWVSDEEERDAKDTDLLYYGSMDELHNALGSTAKCVAVEFESISGTVQAGSGYSAAPYFKVLEDAEIGKVGMFTSYVRIYRENQNITREEANIASQEGKPISLPVAGWTFNAGRSYNGTDNTGKGAYIKTAYDEDGNIKTGTHFGGQNYGQSLLVVGATSSITKGTKDNKTNYVLSRGENTVEWHVNAEGRTSGNADGSEEKTVDMTITETIPKELTYVPYSANLGEPEITETENGWTLKWTVNDYVLDSGKKELIYKTSIDETLQNGTQLDTTSVVHLSDYDFSGPLSRTAKKSISVSNLSSYRLYKSVKKNAVEIEEIIVFNESFVNFNDYSTPDFVLYDILPFNGDVRGTSYNGSYKVETVTAEMTSLETGEEKEMSGIDFLYSDNIREGDAKTVNLDTFTQAAFGNIDRQIASFALRGDVPAMHRIDIKITLAPSGNKAADIYANDVTAQTATETAKMETPAIKAGVMDRSIEGRVFYDLDRDGSRSDEEESLSGYDVIIRDADGNSVKDLSGNTIKPVSTDNNGFYKFSHLPGGDYELVITRTDGWKTTIKNETDTGNRSEDGNGQESVIKAVHLKTQDEMNSEMIWTDYLQHQNFGIYFGGTIHIKKTSSKTQAPLSGAGFTIYTGSSQDRLHEVYADGSGNIALYGAAGYDLTGMEAYAIETGEDGAARFENLPEGTYYIKETNAPDGHTISDRTAVVNITKDEAEYTITYDDNILYNLPDTGGNGAYTAHIVEILAAVAGVIFLLGYRRAAHNAYE